MSTRLIFLFFCAFALRFVPTGGICRVSKYTGTYGDWIKCSRATIDEAIQTALKTSSTIFAITITHSQIFEIRANAFSHYANTLQALTLQDSGVRQIHPNAFSGLRYLKKLILSNNNITDVRAIWFDSLASLEHLDLSSNAIRTIEPATFGKLTNLQKLELNSNQLTCLEPKDMEPMRSIAKIRVLGNPLSMTCRARMTLWFNDKGIYYANALDLKSESWLDRVLWLCAEDDYVQTITELRMRQCLLLNLFNQLQLALKTTISYSTAAQHCNVERRIFTSCIASSGQGSSPVTNGEAAMKMILALRDVQTKLNLPRY